MPKLRESEKTLPPGYRMQIGGEYDKTKTGFSNLAQALIGATFAIFMALVFQFNNAIEPITLYWLPRLTEWWGQSSHCGSCTIPLDLWRSSAWPVWWESL